MFKSLIFKRTTQLLFWSAYVTCSLVVLGQSQIVRKNFRGLASVEAELSPMITYQWNGSQSIFPEDRNSALVQETPWWMLKKKSSECTLENDTSLRVIAQTSNKQFFRIQVLSRPKATTGCLKWTTFKLSQAEVQSSLRPTDKNPLSFTFDQ